MRKRERERKNTRSQSTYTKANEGSILIEKSSKLFVLVNFVSVLCAVSYAFASTLAVCYFSRLLLLSLLLSFCYCFAFCLHTSVVVLSFVLALALALRCRLLDACLSFCLSKFTTASYERLYAILCYATPLKLAAVLLYYAMLCCALSYPRLS